MNTAVNEAFNTETLLTMDYTTLQRYMDAMVIKRPKIVLEMRKQSIPDMIKKMNTVHALSYLVTVRCICAFIGIADPVIRPLTRIQ